MGDGFGAIVVPCWLSLVRLGCNPRPAGPIWVLVRRFQTRGEAALYLWDYFYLSSGPEAGDEKAWRRIESATRRIMELESSLRPTVPDEVRLRSARLLRRAVRVVTGQLPRLEPEVARWVHEVLAVLEADASAVIADLQHTASPALH